MGVADLLDELPLLPRDSFRCRSLRPVPESDPPPPPCPLPGLVGPDLPLALPLFSLSVLCRGESDLWCLLPEPCLLACCPW